MHVTKQVSDWQLRGTMTSNNSWSMRVTFPTYNAKHTCLLCIDTLKCAADETGVLTVR